MPPPSPVWDWDPKGKPSAKIFRDASFQMMVKIDGQLAESHTVKLKVKGAKREE